MRLVVVAGNRLSQRAIAMIASLDQKGMAPVGCLCLSMINLKNVSRIITEYGYSDIFRFVMNRTSMKGSTSTAENPYLKKRLNDLGVKHSDLLSLCRSQSIPFSTVRNINSSQAVETVKNWDADLLIYCGGGILRGNLIGASRLGVLNAHAGRLPLIRGMNTVEWAFMEGVPIGITAHLIDSGIDTGDILFHCDLSIDKTDVCLQSLKHRVADATVDVMIDGIKSLHNQQDKPTKQKNTDGSQYYVMHEILRRHVETELEVQRLAVETKSQVV